MPVDFDRINSYLHLAKKDVETSLKIWSQVLIDYFDHQIELVYVKGSAIKEWNGFIDYVPILSDIDIHIKIKQNEEKTINKLDYTIALDISSEYERRFKDQCLCHIPRTQIIFINQLQEQIEYIPPHKESVRILLDRCISLDNEFLNSRSSKYSKEFIREVDHKRLEEEQEFLQKVPFSIMDRSGIDHWTTIRRICWRVSPAPVRLLTQLSDNVSNLWMMNRTQIMGELRTRGLDSIANSYYNYYLDGWKLFFSDFSNTKYYLGCIRNGLDVLRQCLFELKKL
ncbi:MAG: hypothetical protein ACXAD7_13055 [Candidatus Kariarchaeaceae archaeon]|jgi:hypothetical protein